MGGSDPLGSTTLVSLLERKKQLEMNLVDFQIQLKIQIKRDLRKDKAISAGQYEIHAVCAYLRIPIMRGWLPGHRVTPTHSRRYRLAWEILSDLSHTPNPSLALDCVVILACDGSDSDLAREYLCTVERGSSLILRAIDLRRMAHGLAETKLATADRADHDPPRPLPLTAVQQSASARSYDARIYRRDLIIDRLDQDRQISKLPGHYGYHPTATAPRRGSAGIYGSMVGLVGGGYDPVSHWAWHGAQCKRCGSQLDIHLGLSGEVQCPCGTKYRVDRPSGTRYAPSIISIDPLPHVSRPDTSLPRQEAGREARTKSALDLLSDISRRSHDAVVQRREDRQRAKKDKRRDSRRTKTA